MNWRIAALYAFGVGTLWMPRAAYAATPATSPTPVESAADPDLPQPLDKSAMSSLLKNPPFNRVVDYTDSLLLTGVAYVDGKPLATLMDKATKKNYVVSETPNAQGWRLAGATVGSQLRATQIKLQVGDEVVTIRYSDSQINPQKKALSTEVKMPTEQEAIIKDSSGNTFVRTSLYLSEADRDKYHNGISREAHDQYRDTMRNNTEKLLTMSPEQRAAFAKQVLDQVSANDKGGSPQDRGNGGPGGRRRQ